MDSSVRWNDEDLLSLYSTHHVRAEALQMVYSGRQLGDQRFMFITVFHDVLKHDKRRRF